MDLALEYPKVAIVMLVTVGVVAEETFAEHPMLGNTFTYIMFSLDPEAAEVIFPPEVPVSEAELAIDKIAADIIYRSAEDYYDSPEYKQLELDVRAKMHQEVLAAVGQMSGMEELAGPVPVVPASPVDVEEPPIEPSVEVEEPPIEEALIPEE